MNTYEYQFIDIMPNIFPPCKRIIFSKRFGTIVERQKRLFYSDISVAHTHTQFNRTGETNRLEPKYDFYTLFCTYSERND